MSGAADQDPKAKIKLSQRDVARIVLAHLAKAGRVPPGAQCCVEFVWGSQTVEVTWPSEEGERESGPASLNKRTLRIVAKDGDGER